MAFILDWKNITINIRIFLLFFSKQPFYFVFFSLSLSLLFMDSSIPEEEQEIQRKIYSIEFILLTFFFVTRVVIEKSTAEENKEIFLRSLMSQVFFHN
jgi:hypothetical protein